MEKQLYSSLEKSFQQLLDTLSSLDETALNTVPFNGSWTAAQVGEHLRKSYDMAEHLTTNVTPTHHRPPDAYVVPLSEQFLNFDVKMQSPDFILPREGHIDKERLMKGLKERTSFLLEFARSDADMTLTCLGFDLPGLGAMTRLEWLNFILVHAARHNRQLENIVQQLNKGTL